MIAKYKREPIYHPSPVNSYDDLPYPVAETLNQHQIVPQAIIKLPPHPFLDRRKQRIPSLGLRWRTTPHRVLVFEADALTIAEWDGDINTQITRVPLADTVEFRLESKLLHAWLGLMWQINESIVQTDVEFNSVGMELIEPCLDTLRQQACTPTTEPVPALDKRALPLKFRNYIQISLLPNEEPLLLHYEPAIYSPTWYGQTALTPNRLLALTPHHLIIVEDGAHEHRLPYRICRRYIPRTHVQRAQAKFDLQQASMMIEVGHVPGPYQVSIDVRQDVVATLSRSINRWCK